VVGAEWLWQKRWARGVKKETEQRCEEERTVVAWRSGRNPNCKETTHIT